MPNWTKSIITFDHEDRLNQVLDLMRNEEEEINFDFNKVIPMPKSLKISSGTQTDYGIALILAQDHNDFSQIDEILDYGWVRGNDNIKTRQDLIDHIIKNNMADIEEGRTALDNISKYGHKDWYDWSIENWGTKWNACDFQQLSNTVIMIDTAWSPPLEVFRAISEKFPELPFKVEFADEDTGSGVGECTFQGGTIIESNIPESGSREAYRMAFDINGVEYMVDSFVNGDWEEYRDEYPEYYESALEVIAEQHLLDEDFPKEALEHGLKYLESIEDYEYASKVQEMIKEKVD